MLGSSSLQGLGLFALSFVLVAAYPQPELQRYQHAFVPEEPDIMELPNGLVDDYGILPKHPRLRIAHPFLSRAQKRKRDGPDLSEYYYDAHP
ncbi:protein Frey 1 [Sminthopsis crassicaudata]|uniref:protein Frey 1 n=1 Tax=Sminthopsis crassicaudata TaxID=9301 RepID=UPI003D687D1F